jgi:hypothetical protein
MEFTLAQTLEILQRTPHVLRALLSGLSQEWTHHDYGPNTWPAREVLAHLIFAEYTDWIPRARHIVEHGDATPFPPFDRAGHKEPSRGKSVAQLLSEFEQARRDSLDALAALKLTETTLDQSGRHPALGPVTLRHLIATWAVHDLNHIAQICKAMAFQYKGAVGPWEQYMSILAPPNPR